MAEVDQRNGGRIPVVKKQLQGYVGFANLPNQVHRKSVKKGFHFTVMVVGKLSGSLRRVGRGEARKIDQFLMGYMILFLFHFSKNKKRFL